MGRSVSVLYERCTVLHRFRDHRFSLGKTSAVIGVIIIDTDGSRPATGHTLHVKAANVEA